MNVNTSTNVYSYVQNASGNVAKTTSSQPAIVSSATVAQSSGQTMISGHRLMISRLFGNTNTIPQVQTQLTKETSDMDAVNFLTLDDRSMLSDLYAKAQDQGTDLRYVDDLARDLWVYRKFGPVSGSYNGGTTYDENWRVETVDFTEKDSKTASRILNSGNASSSVLDSGFLKYELGSGYSFNHVANFEFIESVVNNSGQTAASADLTQGSKFSTYVSQGQNNFVITTASEVTLQTEKPDWGVKDGVFFVTETGMGNGFQLESGKVVQDKKTSIADIQSQNTTTLLDYFVNKNKTEESSSDKSATLFDYLFAANADKKI